MKFGKVYAEAHAQLFPFHIFLDPWALMLKDKAGTNMESDLEVYRKGGVELFTNEKEQTQIAKELLHRLINGDFEKVRDKTQKMLKRLDERSDILHKMDFARMKTRALVKEYEDYCREAIELNSWGTIITLIETGHESVLTEAAYSYLLRKGTENGIPEKVAEALSILCSPVKGTYLREKKIGEIKIALLAKKKGLNTSEVQDAIRNLHEKYCWASYGYEGPEMSIDDFTNEINHFTKAKNLEQELENTIHEDEITVRKQQLLEKLFKFDAEGKRLFDIARTFMWQKEMRKQIFYRSFFEIMPLRKELAKRIGISLGQISYILPEELPDLIEGKITADELNERYKLLVYQPYFHKMLTGKEAEKFLKTNVVEKQVEIAGGELKGQAAYSAQTVRGKVKLVINAHDLHKLKEGEILVSPATSPVMVPAMKIAGAIVTDQGGLTCHAAIVSRELRKPCVIGTKFATKLLKDGDLIEVDSTKGIVRKLNG